MSSSPCQRTPARLLDQVGLPKTAASTVKSLCDIDPEHRDACSACPRTLAWQCGRTGCLRAASYASFVRLVGEIQICTQPLPHRKHSAPSCSGQRSHPGHRKSTTCSHIKSVRGKALPQCNLHNVQPNSHVKTQL